MHGQAELQLVCQRWLQEQLLSMEVQMCVASTQQCSSAASTPSDTMCVSAHSVLCRHGISSLNNLVVLAAAVAYGWILAGKISLGL